MQLTDEEIKELEDIVDQAIKETMVYKQEFCSDGVLRSFIEKFISETHDKSIKYEVTIRAI